MSRITAGNRISITGTARSAFPTVTPTPLPPRWNGEKVASNCGNRLRFALVGFAAIRFGLVRSLQMPHSGHSAAHCPRFRERIASNRGFEECGRILDGRGHGRRAARPAPAPLQHRQHPQQRLPHAPPRPSLQGHPPRHRPAMSLHLERTTPRTPLDPSPLSDIFKAHKVGHFPCRLTHTAQVVRAWPPTRGYRPAFNNVDKWWGVPCTQWDWRGDAAPPF